MSDHMPACDDEGCYCPDDVFWARLLGDDDPCAPGKDWVGAAFDAQVRVESRHDLTSPTSEVRP